MTAQRTHIVVIGGGYAGTLAANHLRLRADVDITVVNPRPVFVERIRLHQMAAGSGTAAVDYGTLLGEGIELVVDTAERINTVDRQVELASSFVLDYDYLIYAVGSTGVGHSYSAAAAAGIPGIILESGGNGLWTEATVMLITDGVRRIMAQLGMCADAGARAPATRVGRMVVTKAPDAGFWHPAIKPGDTIARGDRAGARQRRSQDQ